MSRRDRSPGASDRSWPPMPGTRHGPRRTDSRDRPDPPDAPRNVRAGTSGRRVCSLPRAMTAGRSPGTIRAEVADHLRRMVVLALDRDLSGPVAPHVGFLLEPVADPFPLGVAGG